MWRFRERIASRRVRRPASALEEIEGALEMSRRIDYPIGVAVNLRSRAFAELLRDDVDAARATVAEFLDDVLERGAMSHARLVVDVAAVLAHRIGDVAWAQLASTAAALPTATLVGAGYDLVPLPAGSARPLGRRDAIAMVVRLLASAPPVSEAAPPDAAPAGKTRRHHSSSADTCGTSATAVAS